MFQPARTLHSNAPPSGDGAVSVYHASRVLQEHSGNRQFNGGSAFVEHDEKHAQMSPESIWYPPQQPYYVAPSQRALPHHQQAWAYGQHPRGYGYYSAEDEEMISYRARQLWKHFQSSDGYNKYRARQQKDDKLGQEPKWPDALERAFFRALVKYPPMGRRKVMHKEKQCGRNELIADHIQEITGVLRSRKQVSSHIQVLKPFVEHDSHIMKWLSKEDMGLQPARYHGSPRTRGILKSRYPAATLMHAAVRRATPTNEFSQRGALSTVRQLKHGLDIFEPIKFSMFVQRCSKLPNGEQYEHRLHTYTENSENARGPDIHFRTWQAFEQHYPQLAAMNTQKPLDCNVIVANASLVFPAEAFKGSDNNVELGISFVCCSRHLLPTPSNPDTQPPMTVRCRNTFYKDGWLMAEHSGWNGTFDLTMEPTVDGRSVTASLKFGSRFWAHTLAQLAVGRLGAATEDGKTPREEVDSSLQAITVVQEVVVMSQQGYTRILVMQWAFDQSSTATGKTSWRRVVLPSAETSVVQYSGSKTRRTNPTCNGTSRARFAGGPVFRPRSALQFPFDYQENSSGSGLSPATWPMSAGEGNGMACSNFSVFLNNFGSGGENGDIAWGTSFEAANFDNGNPAFDNSALDSSVFNFDTAVAEFAQDPALDEYPQHWRDTNNGNVSNGQTAPTLFGIDTHVGYSLP